MFCRGGKVTEIVTPKDPKWVNPVNRLSGTLVTIEFYNPKDPKVPVRIFFNGLPNKNLPQHLLDVLVRAQSAPSGKDCIAICYDADEVPLEEKPLTETPIVSISLGNCL